MKRKSDVALDATQKTLISFFGRSNGTPSSGPKLSFDSSEDINRISTLLEGTAQKKPAAQNLSFDHADCTVARPKSSPAKVSQNSTTDNSVKPPAAPSSALSRCQGAPSPPVAKAASAATAATPKPASKQLPVTKPSPTTTSTSSTSTAPSTSTPTKLSKPAPAHPSPSSVPAVKPLTSSHSPSSEPAKRSTTSNTKSSSSTNGSAPSSSSAPHPASQKRATRSWTEADEQVVRKAFPLYRELESVYEIIASELDDRTPREVAQYLFELNLISATELRTAKVRHPETEILAPKRNEETTVLPNSNGKSAQNNSDSEALDLVQKLQHDPTGLGACRWLTAKLRDALAMRSRGNQALLLDYLIEPKGDDEHSYLSDDEIQRLMELLGFETFINRQGLAFWSISNKRTAAEIEHMIQVVTLDLQKRKTSELSSQKSASTSSPFSSQQRLSQDEEIEQALERAKSETKELDEFELEEVWDDDQSPIAKKAKPKPKPKPAPSPSTASSTPKQPKLSKTFSSNSSALYQSLTKSPSMLSSPSASSTNTKIMYQTKMPDIADSILGSIKPPSKDPSPRKAATSTTTTARSNAAPKMPKPISTTKSISGDSGLDDIFGIDENANESSSE